MKHLNRNQWIAVFASMGLLAYLLFTPQIMAIFNPSSNNNTNQSSTSGVAVTELVVGQGEIVASGDVLTAHYVGKLADGRVFDSSYDRNTPITFVVGQGQVIRGWDEGLIGMRVGGKRALVIQPDYGYGASGAGPIPPNSVLYFEVELLNAQKQQ